jgi:hypothetical protein
LQRLNGWKRITSASLSAVWACCLGSIHVHRACYICSIFLLVWLIHPRCIDLNLVIICSRWTVNLRQTGCTLLACENWTRLYIHAMVPQNRPITLHALCIKLPSLVYWISSFASVADSCRAAPKNLFDIYTR